MKRYLGLLMGVLTMAMLAACADVTPPPAEPAAPESMEAASTEADIAETPVEQEPTPETSHAQQLISAFDAAPEANGDILYLFGQVLDVSGDALPEALVEIWQTDADGIYDHPGDRGTADRDPSFQFFGSSTVDDEGWYAFRTIIPGRYEPRPRHIHYKVKQNGETLLTSQFYFSDDIATVEGEAMFRAVGESGDLLLLQLVQGEDGLLANGSIVVDTGIGEGELPLTPAQAEGPYYPLVPPADYDNDLTRLP